jgi:hypothetical protein
VNSAEPLMPMPPGIPPGRSRSAEARCWGERTGIICLMPGIKHIMLAEARNGERRSGGVTSDNGTYSLYISQILLTNGH